MISHKDQRPLVSILCLSYNQKDYIKQTIDSFLMQETNFSYEILINDDASTDGTKEIIEEYAKKHTNIFPVFHKENQYQKGKRNMIIRYLLPNVRGKYIALCEGDDFWTDPTKLQRQVDFLEKHEDYALVFHPVRVFFEKGEREDSVFPDTKSDFTVKRLLQGNFIQTNSVMYRARKEYKGMALDVMPGDWYLHLYHAQFGKIGFIDRIMSAYRRHAAGIWWRNGRAGQSEFLQMVIYGHIRLADEMKKMFANNKILYAEANMFIRKLVSETIVQNKNETEFITELMRRVPEVICDTVAGNQEEIDDLKKKIERLREEVDSLKTTNQKVIYDSRRLNRELVDIKSSKAWRAVSSLRKYKARLSRR